MGLKEDNNKEEVRRKGRRGKRRDANDGGRGEQLKRREKVGIGIVYHLKKIKVSCNDHKISFY